jgi:hypothetical protein
MTPAPHVKECRDIFPDCELIQGGCEIAARRRETLQNLNPGVEVSNECLVFALTKDLREKRLACLAFFAENTRLAATGVDHNSDGERKI